MRSTGMPSNPKVLPLRIKGEGQPALPAPMEGFILSIFTQGALL